jgi:hypothetical protein
MEHLDRVGLPHIYIGVVLVALVLLRDPTKFTVGFLVLLWTITIAIHAILHTSETSAIEALRLAADGIQVLINIIRAFA